MNKVFKYPKLAKELIAMAETDQAMRFKSQDGKQEFDINIDINNTNRLKEIVSQIGWPTINKVGKQASIASWLIIQHADHDKVFQQKCLKIMIQSGKDVLPSNIAYLTDRVAVNNGKYQRFGTQFYQDKKGNLIPRPIKNIKSLDKIRLKIGLEPFEEYKQKLLSNFK